MSLSPPFSNDIPVWILSTTNQTTSTTVFSGRLCWWDPCIVNYDIDSSFEVVNDPSKRLRPKTEDEPPPAWGEVSWSDIKNFCFDKDPRELAAYRGIGRQAKPSDVGVFAKQVHRCPREDPEQEKRLRLTKPAPDLEPPSSLDLLTDYAADKTVIPPTELARKTGVFLSSSPFSLEIARAQIDVETYQPPSTKATYRAAVRKFVDYIRVAQVDPKALASAEALGDVVSGFFVTRIGQAPKAAESLGWKAVAATTAKTEATAIIAVLRLLGAPTPAFATLHTAFKKSGALRTKPHSEKLPLFASNLETIWKGVLEVKTEALSVRNFALCCVTFFFMLRGGESRILKRQQLELIKPEGTQTWKVTLDHSKSDPLILGRPPEGGSWSGFCSNVLLSEVLSFYFKVFLGNDYPPELPLFPQVEVWRCAHNPSDKFSRRAPGAPNTSWKLLPLESTAGGKRKGGPLTTSDPINRWLKETLPKIGITTHHTMHSLRGAAPEALALGATIPQIKQMGHWKSLAVLTYAVETLTGIEDKTRAFGSKEFQTVGGLIEVNVRDKINTWLADENGEDENGERSSRSGPSTSPSPK